MILRGDIYYADLRPVVGSEQGGIRPVLIVQNDVGNRHSPTVICAAITSQMHKAKLPTHVALDSEKYDLAKDSVVLLEQLRTIDKKRNEIEERIENDTREDDLIALHELESTLVYFATSLRANGNVLDRLTRYKRLEQYPEDKELLDDVIIENKQAIEMTVIYRDIINGTRELMSSVLDNRLNNVMKTLTSITLIMAVPTVISGIYGMNVNSEGMPFATLPFGFGIICALIVVVCVFMLWFLKKKKML